MNKCEISTRDVCHRPACVVVGQEKSFLMMLSEVSTPPRSPNTSALGTRMQNPDTSSPYRVVVPDDILALPVETDPRTLLFGFMRKKPVIIAITIQH